MARRGPKKDFPRTARVGQLIREIVASEIERIDDDRLYPVAITGVDVDNELAKAVVYYDVLHDEDRPTAAEALEGSRHRIQTALGQQSSMRRTPTLHFVLDRSISSAGRIDEILGNLEIPDETPLGTNDDPAGD